MLTVLLGGARSGKSSLAEAMGRGATGAVTLIATSPQIAGDDDLDARIERHRADRPDTWETIEEQLDLAGAIGRADDGFVIIDCLTTWVGNLLYHDHTESEVLAAADAALRELAIRAGSTVVITNEVGLGIIPDNLLARQYRDILGRVNQRLVAAADHALFMVAGKAFALDDPNELLR
jgi:adenosylcobinamide kinase / adenosylcobinamide-phosphate guanylyltransferase